VIDADQIIVTNGALEAILLAARVVTPPRNWIAVENPGWVLARQSLRHDGHDVRPVAADLDGLDVDALLGVRPPRLVLVTPAHQLPLGGRLPMARRTALLDWIEVTSGWIIEDDYDGEFRFDVPPLPALAALARTDRVIYIGSFSKTLTPQLRIGYLVGPPDLVENVARLKMFTSQYTSLPNQLAIARFMGEGHYNRHLNRMRRVYSERRSRLVNVLSAAPGDVSGIEGGLHAYWRFPSCRSAQTMSNELGKHDIQLLPIDHFTEGRAPWHGFVVGYGPADADQKLEHFRKALRTLRSAR
jgi:GntR family transcriptional regulator/MocR family aminotransferase